MGDAWARSHAPAPVVPEGDVVAHATAWLEDLNSTLSGHFKRHAGTDMANNGNRNEPNPN